MRGEVRWVKDVVDVSVLVCLGCGGVIVGPIIVYNELSRVGGLAVSSE